MKSAHILYLENKDIILLEIKKLLWNKSSCWSLYFLLQ